MLQVSQRAHYGLRAMTELAKAYGRGTLSLAEIAEAEHLPVGYLEQLAMPLRRAGLIEGTRGAHGGYRLAHPPAEMTVGQVVRALEGEVTPVECLAVEYVAGACVREIDCLSRPLWQRVKESIDQVLDTTTLADLSTSPEFRVEPALISTLSQREREPGSLPEGGGPNPLPPHGGGLGRGGISLPVDNCYVPSLNR